MGSKRKVLLRDYGAVFTLESNMAAYIELEDAWPCQSVQLFSRVQFIATPWTAARQASLSITNSWSLLKLMSIESVMPSSHLILCRPLLLLPSVFPSIRVFPSESVLRIKWPKYWEFQLQHQFFQWKGEQNLVKKKLESWLRMVLDFRTAEASRQWGGTFKMEVKWLQIW